MSPVCSEGFDVKCILLVMVKKENSLVDFCRRGMTFVSLRFGRKYKMDWRDWIAKGLKLESTGALGKEKTDFSFYV